MSTEISYHHITDTTVLQDGPAQHAACRTNRLVCETIDNSHNTPADELPSLYLQGALDSDSGYSEHSDMDAPAVPRQQRGTFKRPRRLSTDTIRWGQADEQLSVGQAAAGTAQKLRELVSTPSRSRACGIGCDQDPVRDTAAALALVVAGAANRPRDTLTSDHSDGQLQQALQQRLAVRIDNMYETILGKQARLLQLQVALLGVASTEENEAPRQMVREISDKLQSEIDSLTDQYRKLKCSAIYAASDDYMFLR
eukprot:TRINITY_DN2182_c0_g1_i2.p1 TRINITY_DN2182_c0_g1~~TRINITY_DN2182_c0_g1_i2.p1  ORF type:complete len:254 (-),score=34.21 TRINITY_DN2182_c0_g1_i2:130-891(-)